MRPYRDSLAAGLSAALVSGLVMATIDLLIARQGDGLEGSGLELFWLLAGLYGPPCLLAAALVGGLAGAWRATFGDAILGTGWRRLRSEPELDCRITGALFAGAVIALIFVVFASLLAKGLVAEVERKRVGAALFGACAAASLPAFALLGVPVYRVTRRVAALLPRSARLPSTLLATLGGVVAAAALLGAAVFTRLDWRALDLGRLLLPAGLLAVGLLWTLLWRLILPGLRQRIPARGALAGAAAAASVVISALALRATPSPHALFLLTEHTIGGRTLLALARGMSDRDGDGYSALLGGPDCDDANPAVHPDAPEIPGNGIDDNCLGGDRSATATALESTRVPSTHTDLGFRGNLLFVIIDTMRADRLGLTGYRRNDRSLTPNLDAFGARACYFRRAYAQATNTARSLPSMFNSLYPSQVLVDRQYRNFSQTLEDNLSVFEVLEHAGLHTVGFSSHYFFEVNLGARQGFDEYDNQGAKTMEEATDEVSAPRIISRALVRLEELAQSGERFAMFVHVFEPHSAYVLHPEFPEAAGGERRARYDYEIAFDDLWIGRLLDALEHHGLSERTMVVILADHGEAFGEHQVAGQRIFYHGRTLYEELLRVPLLIRIPGLEPRSIDTPVMLVDVAPTIAEAMGLEVPASFRGRSLVPAMVGAPLAARPSFAEMLPAPYWNHSAKAMISEDGKTKIIYFISERRFELYDLEADPGETRNLYRRQPELGEVMTRTMANWIEGDLQSGW